MGIDINKTKKALLIAALVLGGTIATNAQVVVSLGTDTAFNDFAIPVFTFDFTGKGIADIASVQLSLSMNYTAASSGFGPANLSASLKAPDATTATVFNLSGNSQTTVTFSGANFLDAALINLPVNDATYSGSYDPSVAFSAFEGLSSGNINGAWTLTLTDSNQNGDGGNMLSATSLTITAAVPEPSAYAAMMGLGMLGFATFRRFRAQSAA